MRLALVLLLACGCALAQPRQAPVFEPTFGQEGKDVVWVPTSAPLVEKMLDMARVTPRDVVMDLGSGDGRTVIAAAKRGARAIGIEYDADMVALSRRNAERAGVAARARFEKRDLFETDFSEATVISMFLLPSINVRLRPKLLALQPGTRIVTNTFGMDEWLPDESATLPQESGCDSWCNAHLWIVPAQVAGRHVLPIGELELKQAFQVLSGSLRAGGTHYALEGRVRGEDVTLRAGGREYRGRMRDGKLTLQ